MKFSNNFFFRFCEFFYRLGFSLVVFFKKRNQFTVKYPVVSVGNISVGGTGKSPVVIFLSKKIVGNGAIVTRGYGRSFRSAKNVLVLNNKDLSVRDIGDEAMMFSYKLSTPVVVGSNRKKSVALLEKKNIKVDYILMDDAYQNFQLKKDFEILLLDARAPFGNGHCLPAGPLREKDLTRASVIILTHADEISCAAVDNLKRSVSNIGVPVFTGRHSVKDLVDCSGNVIFCGDKKFMAVAGIGSFSGFLLSLKNFGIDIKEKVEFSDHFSYDHKDVLAIIKKLRFSGCDAIVTTEKDWERFRNVVGEYKNLFFVLRISFEFLSEIEEKAFFKIFYERTQLMAGN